MALDAIEQLLVANHGFTVTPEGAVVSPNGQIRNVVNGKPTFTPYTPPTTEPTFAEQFAAQQAQAIADTNQVRQDEASASGSDTYQSVATDGSGAVTPVNLQEQILSVGQPTFSSGSPTQALPAAPTQTTDQLKAAIDEARDLNLEPSQRYKNQTSDLTGIKYTDKKAFEYDLGPEYDNVVAVRSGKGVKFYKDGERVDSDVLGIDSLSGESGNDKISSLFSQLRDQEVQDVYDQFGGEDGTLVSEYLSDQAALAAQRARTDERQDAAMVANIGKNYTGNTFLENLSAAGQDLKDRFGFGEEKYNDADAFNEGQGSVVNYADIVGDTPYSYKNTDLGKNYDNSYTGEIPLSELGAYTGDVATYGGDMGVGQSQMYDGMSGTYDLYDEPLEGGLNIPGTNLTITAGDPVGPGAGSNTGSGGSNVGGGGDGNGGQPDDDFNDIGGGGIGVGVPVIGPGDVGGGTGGTGGGGIGTGGIGGSQPDPSTYIVPSTVNYGTDPRFANLAPTYKVSKAAMPIFNRFDPAPSIPPVPVEEEETSLLAQGGIVSLAGGGTPKGQGISPDFMVDTYYPSLIPKALDGNKAAKEALLEAHSKLDNFTLPEELLVRIKRSFRHGGVAERGYSHEGIGSLSDTARNMFRPMVS